MRYAGENVPDAELSAATQTSVGLVLSIISWMGAALLCVPVFRWRASYGLGDAWILIPLLGASLWAAVAAVFTIAAVFTGSGRTWTRLVVLAFSIAGTAVMFLAWSHVGNQPRQQMGP